MTVQEFYPTFLKYQQVCTDSRQAAANSIFFALKGDNFDGNKYVLQSLEMGCAYAVSDDPSLSEEDNVVLVNDVLEFLQKLARYHRDQFTIPVIGLTGTNGKTTTKELVAAILSKKYKLTYTEGNLNNHIGVPLTVLKANNDTEILLVEMGANHVGEIDFLCNIAKPDHGLITNIGRAHLEGFGSFEGVIQAKTEMYRYLLSKGGKIFVNQEDELLVSLIDQELYLPYGGGTKPAPVARLHPGIKLSFDLDLTQIGEDKTLCVGTNLVGNYNLPNALAALALGANFAVDWQVAVDALKFYQPGMNRSEFRETDKNILILDAYNANPGSMLEALRVFGELRASGKIAMLGEMREMGEFSAASHLEIAEFALEMELELILLGAEFEQVSLEKKIVHFPDVESLIEYVDANPLRDKTILLKGSRGNQLEKVVPYL